MTLEADMGLLPACLLLLVLFVVLPVLGGWFIEAGKGEPPSEPRVRVLPFARR